MNTNVYDRVHTMNNNFGIWGYTERLRVTYVGQGWLVVWDHQETPPKRYDCKGKTHQEACMSVVAKLDELAFN